MVQQFVRHGAQSDGHRKALIKLGLVTGTDETVRSGTNHPKNSEAIFSRKKRRNMEWCLAEGHRHIDQEFCVQANASNSVCKPMLPIPWVDSAWLPAHALRQQHRWKTALAIQCNEMVFKSLKICGWLLNTAWAQVLFKSPRMLAAEQVFILFKSQQLFKHDGSPFNG